MVIINFYCAQYSATTHFRKTFKLNVHYAPKTPVIRPNLATNKLTCESQANPEPNYGWIMPDNSNLLDQNTIDMMVS